MRDIRPKGQKKPFSRPLTEIEAEPEKRVVYDSIAETKKEIKPKPKLTGSAVPVAKIDVPEEPDRRRRARIEPEKPARKPEPAATPPKLAPRKPKRRVGHRERRVVFGLFFVVLVIAILAAIVILPTAKIELVLRTAPLLVDQDIGLAAVSDGSEQEVPYVPGTAFWREIRVTGKAPVTTTVQVGDKARGVVQVVNRTLEAQSLKERSRLETEDGKLFYMIKHVNIPAATPSAPARVSVEVEAAEADDSYNIDPQRLDFVALPAESQTLVYAEATQPIGGGGGDEVSQVTEGAIDETRQEAGRMARSKAAEEIATELPDGWAILDESWTGEIIDFSADAKVGDQVDEIPFEALISVRVFGYDATTAERTLMAALESRLEEDFMLFPGPISSTMTIRDIDWENATAKLTARVTHSTIPRLSIDTLQGKLSGRSELEAREYLEGLPGVRSASITLWPFWAKSVPRITQRIELDLQPEKGP